jgi:integrase
MRRSGVRLPKAAPKVRPGVRASVELLSRSSWHGSCASSPHVVPRSLTPAPCLELLAAQWRGPGQRVAQARDVRDTTGARRGEICGLRWSQLDLDTGVEVFRASVGQIAGERWEKDTKTDHRSRVTLDAELLAVLREHRTRCGERATSLDTCVRRDGFIFSPPVPDCPVIPTQTR